MIKSVMEDLQWPGIVDPRVTRIFSFFNQIQYSQWLSRADLTHFQSVQLARRLQHAKTHIPYYKAILQSITIEQKNAFDVLKGLPILTRSKLQQEAKDLYGWTSDQHGKVSSTVTSGSSGEPVTVKCTAMAFDLRAANVIRGHMWQQVDFRKSFAAIRAGVNLTQGPSSLPNWGGPVGLLFESGPSAAFDISSPIDEQIKWLKVFKPAILMTYPSNLDVLVDHIDQRWDGLSQVLTISEMLSEGLRDKVNQRWGVAVKDKYSSEELGPIAIECAHGNYHVPEHLILEVLDPTGRPCRQGEIGRVVVTDMFNFATGLLRYEIADYAECVDACGCGRSLRAIKRVVGRVRNIMTLPDGTKFWPIFGMRQYGEIAPVTQMQFIQTNLEELLVKYVCERDLSLSEKEQISNRICESVKFKFLVQFEKVGEHELKSKNGKFEEFKSMV